MCYQIMNNKKEGLSTMKIIQEDATNKIKHVQDKMDVVATMPIDMAGSVVDSQEMDEVAEKNMEELRKITRKPFLGAEKQPVPKEPVQPELELNESLFEDITPNISEIKEEVYGILENDIITSLDGMAYRISEEVPEYNDDWCLYVYDSNIATKVDRLLKQLVEAEVEMLFAYAPKDESCNSLKKRNKKRVNENKYDDQGHLIDPHDDDYYEATDIPKGPERDRVKKERRKEFLELHGIEDHEAEWKAMKGKDIEEEEADLHTRVHEELCPTDWDKLKKVTKFDRKPSKRYSLDDIYIDSIDGNTVLLSDTEEGLDFAIEVAEAYDVDYDDPKPYRGLFSIKLYTDGLEYIPV